MKRLSFDDVARSLRKAELGNDVTRINNQSRILVQECIVDTIMIGDDQSRVETA